MIWVVIESLIILCCYASAWFVISILIKRNDFADIAWGLGYILLCAYHFMTKTTHPIGVICYLLVLIWGLRLSVFLFLRNMNKSEDFRYLKWRNEWGKAFYVRSFLQVYLLQALFLLFIISPVLYVASFSESQWSAYTIVGAMIWLFGFYWQSLADHQLRQFIKRRKSKEEVLQTGLWKYSRHPNYFGEVTMWWGIYLIVWPLPGSLPFILGPLTITLLIRYVSGVPMLERRYIDNRNYQEYRRKVPALMPRVF